MRVLCLPCVAVVVVALAVTACERPPVGGLPGDDDVVPGKIGPLAIDTFVQDRPAIAGKWFDYDPSSHAMAPKPHAWIVVAGERVAAFRIASVYEPDTADSGRFTLFVATHDGAAWSPESEWLTPRNVKTTEPLCADLFTSTEVACSDAGWQLRLAMFQYFSPLSAFAVAEPGLFLAPGVLAARVDDVTTLAALPSPDSLAVLPNEPAPTFASTDWAFAALAPDLPRVGMAIGERIQDGDVWWLMTSRFELVRLTLALLDDSRNALADPSTATALRLDASVVAVDRADASVPDTLPPPASVDVALPAAGEGRWLTFTTADLALSADDLEGATWPFAPPATSRWDLAIARTSEGVAQLVVSPAAAVLNATQLGLDEELPPVTATE